MNATNESRQTIVAWWIFYCSDSVEPTPVNVLRWIEEAESDLEKCNSTLANEYDEYIPQRV